MDVSSGNGGDVFQYNCNKSESGSTIWVGQCHPSYESNVVRPVINLLKVALNREQDINDEDLEV